VEFIIENFYLIIASALIFGFFMAYGIGANDVANAMGTSVGSRALTLTQALVIAAIFEFLGAYLAGAEVTTTIKENIVSPSNFDDNPSIFVLGMLASLLAAGAWLLLATVFGLPVSTTHAIIGAIAGFSVFYLGWSSVSWSYIGSITISWLITPLLAALLSGLLYFSAKRLIINSETPIESGRRYIPIYAGLVGFIISAITLNKSLKNTDVPELITITFGGSDLFVVNILISLTVAIACYAISRLILSHYISTTPNPDVEGKFAVLMIFTACSIAFAHGSNDVANAVGPMAAVISTIENLGSIENSSTVPEWVLLTGAIGIVLGMLTLGFRVIRTVGEKITKLKPSKGFAAEMSTAIVVLLGSISGIPLSTTHTLVGAVIGIGIFSKNKVNYKSVLQILGSWFITIPGGAILAIIFFVILKSLFGVT
jgi:PiT family inorganic phosphate transporter